MHTPDIGFEKICCFFLLISHPRDTVSHYAVVHFSVSNRLNRTFHDISGKSMWTPPWRCNFVSGREVTPICVVKLRPTKHGVFANWVVLRRQSGKCCLDGMTLLVTFASKNGWISWMWLVHFKDFPFQGEMFGFVYHWLVHFFRALQRYTAVYGPKYATLGSGFPAMSRHTFQAEKVSCSFPTIATLRSQSQKTPKGPKGLDTYTYHPTCFCLKDPTN